MTTAVQIVERAAAFGIKAKVWEKGDKCRIYAQTGRKDMNIYLELENTASSAPISEDVTGATFKVFCNTPQHRNWIAAQVAEYRKTYIGLFHAYVVEVYRDVGPKPNGYGEDINNMIDEARAFAAHVESEAA